MDSQIAVSLPSHTPGWACELTFEMRPYDLVAISMGGEDGAYGGDTLCRIEWLDDLLEENALVLNGSEGTLALVPEGEFVRVTASDEVGPRKVARFELATLRERIQTLHTMRRKAVRTSRVLI